jgi:DNA-binding beta-propeller fold protein YncE
MMNAGIQKFTSDGVFITTWGSYGSEEGEFRGIGGIAIDSSGYVYMTDSGNNRIQVFSKATTERIEPGDKDDDGPFGCFISTICPIVD